MRKFPMNLIGGSVQVAGRLITYLAGIKMVGVLGKNVSRPGGISADGGIGIGIGKIMSIGRV